MIRIARRLRVITPLALAALVGMPAAAVAETSPGASACSGVTVVVESSEGTTTRCAPGDPATATEALEAAGHEITWTKAYDGKVICRIDGVPESDTCAAMPPATAFWGFFQADPQKPGAAWAFATAGVSDVDPAPGTAIGFRLGDGALPQTSPEAAVASASPSAAASPSSDASTDAADAADETADDGSGSWALVAGLVLLAALVAAVALVAARRRRGETVG
ncbi:hypothetical protein BCF74_11913 [Knoellia remsis]|uniref:MYXO-CTERM domain-containing protein n=1 Tax=Knoellia remsis TaxID=407159 RepID=A0A2T0UEC6_9MICO|nr:hypothetical protein [Knoellia remsis]PRY56296.1 hypothetical protein BCF74_11913 [Knoellia remsis]